MKSQRKVSMPINAFDVFDNMTPPTVRTFCRFWGFNEYYTQFEPVSEASPSDNDDAKEDDLSKQNVAEEEKVNDYLVWNIW